MVDTKKDLRQYLEETKQLGKTAVKYLLRSLQLR